jgi:serine/threonine protein kinase
MDLVDGNDLARLVREHGPMSIEQALDCILQAARGLEYAHAQGVVHRDIKPSNLILDHDGVVRILDLGIARFMSLPEQAGDDLTKTGCVLGTVDYMAPEQAMNTRRADHRSDIYSLGCTLHFLLTGQPIFGGETVMERIVAHREHSVPSLRKACPAAPKWLDAVFRKMVAKKPEDRYQSVTALVSDLERHAAPRSWRRLVVAVMAVLLVAVGAWVAWLVTRPHNDSAQPQKQAKPLELPIRPSDPVPQPRKTNPTEPPVKPNEDQPKKAKPLDLPIKPTWRTTGDYPLVAGVWSVVENKGTLVTIVQHGGDFVATASYKSGEETVSWRAEGRISKSGHITMSFVHTQPHPPDKWLSQTRTAVLNLNGNVLEGYAAFEGGGHKFNWKLVEPGNAEEKELSK